MSRTTIWTCDRCKRDGTGQLFCLDLGKEYISENDKRTIVDLCNECLGWLKAGLKMQTLPAPSKPKCPGQCPTSPMTWSNVRFTCERDRGHDGKHCRTVDGYPHEWEGGLEGAVVPDLFEEALRLSYQVFDITKDIRFHGKNNDQIVLRMPAQSWKDFLVAIDRARKGGA